MGGLGHIISECKFIIQIVRKIKGVKRTCELLAVVCQIKPYCLYLVSLAYVFSPSYSFSYTTTSCVRICVRVHSHALQ